jgi:hypothetical protein
VVRSKVAGRWLHHGQPFSQVTPDYGCRPTSPHVHRPVDRRVVEKGEDRIIMAFRTTTTRVTAELAQKQDVIAGVVQVQHWSPPFVPVLVEKAEETEHRLGHLMKFFVCVFNFCHLPSRSRSFVLDGDIGVDVCQDQFWVIECTGEVERLVDVSLRFLEQMDDLKTSIDFLFR